MTISNFLNPIEEVEAKEEEDGHTVNEEEILQEVRSHNDIWYDY